MAVGLWVPQADAQQSTALPAPGLALFYGGMVRRHNVLGTIMQSFILMAVISIQWVLWGYSVSFGPDVHGLIESVLGWPPGHRVAALPRLRRHHVLGAASGAVAGLVAITPASGYIGPLSAIVIGGVGDHGFCLRRQPLLLKIVDAIIGLRVHEEDEVLGLDLSQHDESAYTLGLVGSAGSAGGSGFFGHRPPSTH